MKYSDPRPCQKGMKCMYEQFDYSEDCWCCGIDFDGTDCPYIKPWGKTKYKKDHSAERVSECGSMA